VVEEPETFCKVKIIVDANIVFSAILNTNSKIGDLLINSKDHFEFIAPNFLQAEIHKYYPKLAKISGMTLAKVHDVEAHVCEDIHFISEEQVRISTWQAASKLVADIDPKDTPDIAFSKHFKCKLWSGDHQLIRGLRKKGFKNIVTTQDLFLIRNPK